MAITLNKNVKTCGKTLYESGIVNVYVVLIGEHEEFLDNEKLKVTEYEESTIYEAQLRGALNSLELSTMNRTQTHDTLLRGVFAPKQTI